MKGGVNLSVYLMAGSSPVMAAAGAEGRPAARGARAAEVIPRHYGALRRRRREIKIGVFEREVDPAQLVNFNDLHRDRIADVHDILDPVDVIRRQL